MPENEAKRRAPAQIGRNGSSFIPWEVHLAAYEVYCEVFGPQEALITGRCRGGFGELELLAFLYARSFPRKEWRERSDEVFNNSKVDR